MRKLANIANAATIAVLALLVAPCIAAPEEAQTAAKAQLAYSNLGPDGGFGTGYYYVSGPANSAFTYAAPFVAGISGNLHHIDVPMQAGSANAAVAISIYPDLNGAPGTYSNGPALEEWLRTTLPETAVAVKLVSKRKPMLTAGQRYWVVMAPVFYDSSIAWKLNSTNQIGVDATQSGGANAWFEYHANGDVMPALDVWVR